VRKFPSDQAKIVEIPAFADTSGSLFRAHAIHARPPARTSPTLTSPSRTEVIRSVLDASLLWQRAARRSQFPTSANRVVCDARQPVTHIRSCSTSARQLTPVDALRSRPARGRDLRRRDRRQRPRLRGCGSTVPNACAGGRSTGPIHGRGALRNDAILGDGFRFATQGHAATRRNLPRILRRKRTRGSRSSSRLITPRSQAAPDQRSTTAPRSIRTFV
jgi:hypothetical protein